jgi:hypothetical protein
MHKPLFPISLQTSSFTEQKQTRATIFRNTSLDIRQFMIHYTKLGKYKKQSRITIIPIHYTRVNWYSLIKIGKKQYAC